jgi:hypothetical protein
VENTGQQRDRGRLFGQLAGWTRTEWRTLLLALAISLTAHLVVLGTPRPKQEGDGRRPVLVVTLTGALVAPRAQQVTAAPSAPSQPVPPNARQSPAPRVLAVPVAKAPTALRTPSATVPAVPPSPPPSVPEAHAVPAPNPAAEEHGTEANEPVQPASPLSSPDLGEVAKRVAGRRLQVRLAIDEKGNVTGASVKLNEISAEVGRLLEEALTTVRFAPALQNRRPVASELVSRLCFDNTGVLDTTSPECLRPQPPAEGQAEVDAPVR